VTHEELFERAQGTLGGLVLVPRKVADPDEAELLAGIEDKDIRDEVAAFRDILGGKLIPLPQRNKFKPTSEKRWVKDTAAKVFAENCELQAKQYAGLTVEQKEELALQRERLDKAALAARLTNRRRTNKEKTK
jgi:hypothetical protein